MSAALAARFLGCLALLAAAAQSRCQSMPPQAERIRQVSAQVGYAQVHDDFAAIAAFGNRLTGSVGERKTFDFFEREMRALGGSISRQPFAVTVPDPKAIGTISCDGSQSPVYPMWPNLVRTNTCHARGPLVYAGAGTLEELSGHAIKGSIVVLEFGSGSNWRNAAELGAAAAIFLAPRSMTRAEAEAKFSSVPLDFPRFYLPLEQAGPILTGAIKGEQAQLDCSQNWIAPNTYNVTATFPGSDAALNSQPIEIVGYSDSMSVVPGIAPGADSIGTVAGLLEIARVAQHEGHGRSLKIVLSGAHGLALLGARNLAEAEFSDLDPPLMVLTLDLSSGSTAIGSFGRGWFYEFRDEEEWVDQQISTNLHGYAADIATVDSISPSRLVLVDAVNNGDSRTWKDNIPGKFALDCEPLVLAGLNAITFRTIDDSRDRFDTPLDTLDHVRISNVVRQIKTSAVLAEHLLNDPISRSLDDLGLPLDPSAPSRSRHIGGFATLAGQVVSYDPNKSFIPDTKQPGALACVMGREKTYMGVRGDYVQATSGPEADYRFVGIATVNSYPDPTAVPPTDLEAYHLNQATGAINMATTWNLPGFEAYNTVFPLTTVYRESPIVVFNSVSVDLYGMVDPQSLQVMNLTRVFDARTGSQPRNFGIFEPPMDQRLSPDVDDAQVLFLPPGQRFQVISGSRSQAQQLILTNSSLDNEAGAGYSAPGGKPAGGRADLPRSGVFPEMALQTAIDLDALNTTRLNRFRKYRIISPDMESLERRAKGEISAADEALSKKDWANAGRHARTAWGFALRAHPIITGTANDVVNGVVFYLFLLIPFSYFMERLLIGESLLIKQFGWVAAIFVASFLVLRLIHPAFEIVTNPSMIFIAFVMGALSITVTFFVLGKFQQSMSMVRAEQVGVHDVDISRSSVAVAAFNLGVSNMRRRKARTILTTLTLVVVTFIVLSFTSIVNKLRLDETPSANKASYAGLLIRTPGWDPLELTTFQQLQNEFRSRAVISRRAYFYGADIGDTGVLSLQRGENNTDLRSMVGLDPSEADVMDLKSALVAGRWFKPDERRAMVLPEPVAEALKIGNSEVGKAQVVFAGVPYTVIAIANASVLRSLTDLDGDDLMPADFSLSRDYQAQRATSNQAFRNFIRIDPSQIFIIPAQTALELGADLRSVAIRFKSPSQARPALESLMPRLNLNLYAGVPGGGSGSPLEVRQFSVQQGSAGEGLWLVAIQLVIASVFVLNTMIASVYERTREIAIFSSIGLAPNHISMLFFAESLVYGILGAVIGYFVAQATARFIVMTNSLPGLTLNFSSTSAVLSAGTVMAIVLGSTIYPARKAAKIAAPAVNEEAFQTEPTGDIWELPLPFSIGADEAAPIARFLEHWLRLYEGHTIGDFVTADTTLMTQGANLRISATTWLAPYDLGVSQHLELLISPGPVAGICVLDLKLVRLSGDAENWPIVNRRFLAGIRRQFLTWRTLSADVRAEYRAPAA